MKIETTKDVINGTYLDRRHFYSSIEYTHDDRPRWKTLPWTGITASLLIMLTVAALLAIFGK